MGGMGRRRVLGEEARVAGLVELLGREAARWDEVMSRLAYWPLDQHPERGLALVEEVAERWSPRARDLPATVLRQLGAGEVRPCLRLERAVDLRPLWAMPRRDRLFARIDGDVHESALPARNRAMARSRNGFAAALVQSEKIQP